jgi:hypothetical protein
MVQKNLLLNANHKKASHHAQELVLGAKNIQPFLPKSNRRIKKGEAEEKASYFLLSARKSSLLCQLPERFSFPTELRVGCPQ